MIHLFIFYAKLILPGLGITSEKGQGLAEYALIILFVAIAIVGALGIFGNSLSAYYQSITDAFP